MSIKTRFEVEGLSELKAAFEELPKATGKNVIKRVLTRRAEPIASDALAKVPVLSGLLKRTIAISIRLSRRQARLAKDSKSYTEIYIGAGPRPQATMQEFGTLKDRPQPYLRPAWDAHKNNLLTDLAKDLWAEIQKAADRLARKAARKASKG